MNSGYALDCCYSVSYLDLNMFCCCLCEQLWQEGGGWARPSIRKAWRRKLLVHVWQVWTARTLHELTGYQTETLWFTRGYIILPYCICGVTRACAKSTSDVSPPLRWSRQSDSRVAVPVLNAHAYIVLRLKCCGITIPMVLLDCVQAAWLVWLSWCWWHGRVLGHSRICAWPWWRKGGDSFVISCVHYSIVIILLKFVAMWAVNSPHWFVNPTILRRFPLSPPPPLKVWCFWVLFFSQTQ
jgi:hypothetical protein